MGCGIRSNRWQLLRWPAHTLGAAASAAAAGVAAVGGQFWPGGQYSVVYRLTPGWFAARGRTSDSLSAAASLASKSTTGVGHLLAAIVVDLFCIAPGARPGSAPIVRLVHISSCREPGNRGGGFLYVPGIAALTMRTSSRTGCAGNRLPLHSMAAGQFVLQLVFRLKAPESSAGSYAFSYSRQISQRCPLFLSRDTLPCRRSGTMH